MLAWTITAVAVDRYARPLPDFHSTAPSLAGALRGFAQHARAHGIHWRRRGLVLRLTITRSPATPR
jgi:hypothetical protein